MCSDEQMNTQREDFKNLWSDLQKGQKPPPKPLMAEPPANVSKARQQPGPHVNGRVLCPPPSWLKQQADNAVDTNTVQNVTDGSNPVITQKPTKVRMLIGCGCSPTSKMTYITWGVKLYSLILSP